MNEFLATGPFDLYELQLFHLVAEHQSFTRAGRAAGLTQSAITRQIRGMEDRLGAQLFERTTRSVRLTPAGAALYARSGAILREVQDAISALKNRFDLGPKLLRVGVARTISLAYLPGFFRHFQTKFPQVQLHVTQRSGAFILGAVESGELDAGIVAAPAQISRAIKVTHRFRDEFTIIAPSKFGFNNETISPKEITAVFPNASWLLPSRATTTGKHLHAWLGTHSLQLSTSMETDNFDLIASLVSLGMGIGIIPHRVLALYPGRRSVQRINTDPKFTRELIVAIRKDTATPTLNGFVENILF